MFEKAQLTETIDFYRYPPIGPEDWEYAYAASLARALELSLLTRHFCVDVINAPTFQAAAELFSGTEYAISPNADPASIEQMLLERRSEARRLFDELIEDKQIVECLRAREDFANMRLAVRRVVTDRPLGTDYSNDGAVPADEFEAIFEQEEYSRFPEYLQTAVEEAVLAYYETKDIRQIDYAIDRVEAAWRIQKAIELNHIFLLSLGRIRVDLHNLRTLFRLRLAERRERQLFLPDGFVDADKFAAALDAPDDALGLVFAATPYVEIVQESAAYLKAEQSFLKLEQKCEDYLMGFLKCARQITAGTQPIIAYLLFKEAEIRTVRMLLMGKKNGLSAKLLSDRLGSWM